MSDNVVVFKGYRVPTVAVITTLLACLKPNLPLARNVEAYLSGKLAPEEGPNLWRRLLETVNVYLSHILYMKLAGVRLASHVYVGWFHVGCEHGRTHFLW